MVGRPLKPCSFINAAALIALRALPVRAWDVVTASDFLSALGIEDRMLANRWIYRRADGTPPFEEQGKWRVSEGAPRVIRKDRAVAWAETGGQCLPARECWTYAADDLAELGWPGLAGPDEVQEVLEFLLSQGVLEFKTPPKRWSELGRLYR